MHCLKSNEYDAYNTMEKLNPYNSMHKEEEEEDERVRTGSEEGQLSKTCNCFC